MSMKGQGITKYNVLIGYTIFFALFQVLIIGFAGDVFSSEIEALTTPTCSLGFIVIDGILQCAFDYISLFFNLFTIDTTIVIVELIFVIPFIISLALIVSDLLRGSG